MYYIQHCNKPQQNLNQTFNSHYSDIIMSAMASQITDVYNVYSTVGSGADQRKHQSSASLAFVRGIHRWPVNSPHKRPVTRKMLPFDDVIMTKDTPYLALTSELWGVYCEDFGEKWPRYNATTLWVAIIDKSVNWITTYYCRIGYPQQSILSKQYKITFNASAVTHNMMDC